MFSAGSHSRAVVVAEAVPSLRAILSRALHTTPGNADRGFADRPPRFSKAPDSRPKRPAFGQNDSQPRRPLPKSAATTVQSQPSNVPASASALLDKPRPRQDEAFTPASSAKRLAKPSEFGDQKKHEGKPAPPHLPELYTAPLAYVSPNELRQGRFPQAQTFDPKRYEAPASSVSKDLAVPKPFSEFDAPSMLVDSMTSWLGPKAQSTPIQSLSLNHLLPTPTPGSRTLLGAETGSGKTLAYLLPMMVNLKATESSAPNVSHDLSRKLMPRAVVLSPTHELTRQSTAMAKRLTHTFKLSAKGMSSTKEGGVGEKRGAVDILFGTGAMVRRMLGLPRTDGTPPPAPGEEKTDWVATNRIDWLVIDEADVLLGQDFIDETMTILQHILKSRPQLHIIFCTATFPPSLFQTLTKAKGLKDAPFTHLLTPSLHKLPPTLETRFVPRSGSGNLFADVAHELKRVLAEDAIKRKEIMLSGQDRDKAKYVVFCNSDRNTRRLSNYMNERDLPNVAWTGDSEQRVKGKNGVLGSFLHDTSLSTKEALLPRHGSAQAPRILVTTGILSRGLDFSPLVTTVFLVDQPKDILDFVHRAGRAGRAGRKGRVVVFGMGTGRPGDAGNLGKEVASVVGTVDKTESRFGGRGQVKRSIGGRLGGRPTGRPTGRQGGRPTGRPVSRQSSAKPYAPTPSKLFGGKTRAMFGIPSKRIPRP